MVEDLAGEEVIPLLPQSLFPAAGRPILALDTMDEVALANIRARASTLAEVHGIQLASATVPQSAIWVYSDPCHPRFGVEVAAQAVADPNRCHIGGSVGICSVEADDGSMVWTHMERVLRSELTTWTSE